MEENKENVPKGFDVKSGWVGKLPDGSAIEFSTEEEYEEFINPTRGEED